VAWQRGPLVSEGERGEAVPFRVEVVLGRGRFGGWAEMAPPSLFLFFFCSFFFSISVFFISS
jgi:hypothetical protein